MITCLLTTKRSSGSSAFAGILRIVCLLQIRDARVEANRLAANAGKGVKKRNKKGGK
jgi:hypothetical protein